MYLAAFHTLGCKVNQYETDAIEKLYRDAGFGIVAFDEYADVYVINTCTVTNLSDRKSRQMIRRAIKQNTDAVIIATGCYAQTSPDEVAKIKGVDLVIGTSQRKSIISKTLTILENIHERSISPDVYIQDIMQEKEFENLEIDDCSERTRAYIKIQDGCTQFCSYCKIPYARGPVRSRPAEEVKKEGIRLAHAGFKEIILTGIHIASYGRDMENVCLIDAIKAIHEIDGVKRIRLGSLEPTVIDESFVKEILEMPKVCSHFHLSLQSGCDETLKRMNRKYTTNEFASAVHHLRASIDHVGISTDIIVGFPGETEEEFAQTAEFIKKIQFSNLHVFQFSPRKGTKAALMKGAVNPAVKEARSREIINLGEESGNNFLMRMVGTTQKILIETQDNTAGELRGSAVDQLSDTAKCWSGYSSNYTKVHVCGDAAVIGEIAEVTVTKLENNRLYGKIL